MATALTEIKVTPEIAAEHGVTAEEYARIQKILGRDPNITELGIFSVMWSEHCSYKSSKVHLKRLPTRGKLVVQGPGENAGVVDIGDGLVAAFKIESHNHPSFIEPFQGATTGVGGKRRSEEHTSELQSHVNLVCRLLLEKKKSRAWTTASTSSSGFARFTTSRRFRTGASPASTSH